MCGGNNENNNTNRRTIITDEYSFESTDETTVKYVKPTPPPAPACTCPPPAPQPVCFCPPPTVKYEPPRYIPLKRCPSLTSVITVNFPAACPEPPKTPSTLRRCASIRRVDESCCQQDNNTVVTLVNLPLNPPRPTRSRATSRTRVCEESTITTVSAPPPLPPPQDNKLVRSTSFSYRSNENLDDLNVKYNFEETIEQGKKECTCPPKVTICTCPPRPNPCPLPVYPTLCPPKPQPSACSCQPPKPSCTCAPKPRECTCPPKPIECTCPPKAIECTCPPKAIECTCPPTKVTIYTCPPPPKSNPCPLPAYPSLCSKNNNSSCLSSSKSFSNLANIETTTHTLRTIQPETIPLSHAIPTTSFEEAKTACQLQGSCQPQQQQQQQQNSVTYVYNDSDNDRQVTYIRHADNDPGLSLPGCLVKASETHLPVNRSVHLGAIFNGQSFGLLSKW